VAGANDFRRPLNEGLPLIIQSPCLDTSMALLKHQIPINATPANVFAGVAAHAGLRGWWTTDAKVDQGKIPGPRV
jgi:hypothetical protein